MKIVFLLPGFPVKPTGGFKIIYQYANFLSRHGYKVVIIHSYLIPTENIYRGNVGKIRLILSYVKMIIKYILNKCDYRKMTNLEWFTFERNVSIRLVSYPNKKVFPVADAVFATAWETATIINDLPEKNGKKYYFIQHYENWSGTNKQIDDSWRLPLKKIVIASWLKEKGKRLGVETNLVPNFIDDSEFYITKSIKERLPVISMLYHDLAWKGSNDGIQALKIIKSKIKDVEIILFGTPDRPEDLPNEFKYYQNPSKSTLRNEIYNKSSIYLSPSHSEGWGLTATEAMACGAALVSTDNGGVRDFGINGDTAFISPVGDIKGLVDNIMILLGNTNERIQVAKSGANLVRKFSIKNSGKLLINILS